MHGLYQPGPLGCGTGWNGPPNTEKRGAASYLWSAGTSGATSPSPRNRPSYFPRLEDERQTIRRKSFTPHEHSRRGRASDGAARRRFHLLTEKGTNTDSVLYRAGPTGYPLAQVNPASAEQLAAFKLPVTVNPLPAPRLTV